MLPLLPADFQEHVVLAFSMRAKQQDMAVIRVALFLDPRFRKAATSSNSGISEFIDWASSFAHKQGWAAASIAALLDQMSTYSFGDAPFDHPIAVGAPFSSRNWWRTVGQHKAAAELAEVALILLDVVPHAAEPERVFSKMGWNGSGKSTWLSNEANTMWTTIKMHYDACRPAKPSRC